MEKYFYAQRHAWSVQSPPEQLQPWEHYLHVHSFAIIRLSHHLLSFAVFPLALAWKLSWKHSLTRSKTQFLFLSTLLTHNHLGTCHAHSFRAAKNPKLKPLAPTVKGKRAYLGGSAQLLLWREGDGEGEITHPSAPLLDGRWCSAGWQDHARGPTGVFQSCTKAQHHATRHSSAGLKEHAAAWRSPQEQYCQQGTDNPGRCNLFPPLVETGSIPQKLPALRAELGHRFQPIPPPSPGLT